MRVRDLLSEVALRGVVLRYDRKEDRLQFSPAGYLPPLLIDGLREHKAVIVGAMCKREERREDRMLEETGIIQSGRQVFTMAREFFGTEQTSP